MANTENLNLDTIEDGQGGRLSHNTNMQTLDDILFCEIQSFQNTPPAGTEGYRYIVGGSPTGDFVGHAGELAVYHSGEWTFYTPKRGWFVFQMASPERCYEFLSGTGGESGTAWYEVTTYAFVASVVAALTDNSGGSIADADTVPSVTSVSTAADAIAVLANKINQILTELKSARLMQTS